MAVSKRSGRAVYLIALGVALLASEGATTQAQELPLTHFTPASDRNPLPSAAVTKVHQDRFGFIWLAIYSSGVVRYDGRTMELFSTADGLSSLGVWDLLEDSSGRLWVGTNAGLVVTEQPLDAYLLGEPVRFTETLGGVPLLTSRVRKNALALDAEGRLWVGTDDSGIIRYELTAAGITRVDTIGTEVDDPEHHLSVRSILARSNGSVWIGLVSGQVLRWRNEEGLQLLLQDDRLLGAAVNLLYETPSGEVWGGGVRGHVFRIDETGLEPAIIHVNQELSANIIGMCATPDGTMWVASEGGGLLKLDADGPARVLTREHGLLSETFHDVTLDRENNVWFAQLSGVSRLRANHAAFINYTSRSHRGEQPALPAPGVAAVAVAGERHPCAVLAGGPGGIACIGRSGERVYLQAFDGLPDEYVNALAFDDEDQLWIGTAGGMASLTFGPERAGRRLSMARQPAALQTHWPVNVASITPLPMKLNAGRVETAPAMWFTSFGRVLAKTGGTWYIFQNEAGVPSVRIHSVAFDDEGRLWLATQNSGIYRSAQPVTIEMLAGVEQRVLEIERATGGALSGQVVLRPLFEQVWSTRNGAPTDEIYRLLSHEGRVWAATSEGIVAIDPDPVATAVHLTTADGLGAGYTMSLALARATGTLWAGTNRGLAELDPSAESVLQTITAQDGLTSNEVWYIGSVDVDRYGRVYFGNAIGLSIYDPAAERREVAPPPLYLRRADLTQGLARNAASIAFVAPSFANERQVRYRTRLLGYSREWSEPTEEARVQFMNLPAFLGRKKYTLEILAANSDGVWTPEPLQYSFAVQPFIWFRWWAIGGQLLLLLLVFAGAIHYQHVRAERRRRETNRERELEHAREIEEAYHELEAAHHELKSVQAKLIHAEKMASLGTLTAGVAHEIRNPLNFVNNFAQLAKELTEELEGEIAAGTPADVVQPLFEDLRMNMNKIEQHGRRADLIVRSMLEHSRGGKREFQDVDVNALVEEFANLAYHATRAEKPDFDLQLVFQLDQSVGPARLVPQELGRVLVNLLNNAIQALEEKREASGTIFVPELTVATKRREQEVEIRVRDNGPGIPEDMRTKIFEPFFTTKPTGTGTGLGLWLSYDIVTLGHGGTLSVESVEGEGSEFIITLPVGKSTRPASRRSQRITA